MERRRRPKPAVAVNPIQAGMIAPCGMNCALCIGHRREKNRCPGCAARRGELRAVPSRHCRIQACTEQGHANRFCGDCPAFPCRRLRQLDVRYRTKYGMSMIENLEVIRTIGIRKFVAREKKRWACPACGQTLCVHRNECLQCGHPR